MTGWELNDAVGLVQQDDIAFVGLLARGQVLTLGTTAPLVLAVALDPALDDVAVEVAQKLGLTPDDVRQDVEHFLAEMERVGALRRRP